MIRTAATILSVAAACVIPALALAQDAPPSYQADPSVYKVIFENPEFRVIEATWKAGQTDKPHAHSIPSVVYALTPCTLKLTEADGTTHIVKNAPGHATAVPIEHRHTATNLTRHTCRAVFVERK